MDEQPEYTTVDSLQKELTELTQQAISSYPKRQELAGRVSTVTIPSNPGPCLRLGLYLSQLIGQRDEFEQIDEASIRKIESIISQLQVMHPESEELAQLERLFSVKKEEHDKMTAERAAKSASEWKWIGGGFAILLVVLVVALTAVSAGNGDATNSYSETESSQGANETSKSKSASKSSSSKTISIGDTIKVKECQFTLVSAYTSKMVGWGDSDEMTTGCHVRIKMKNLSDERVSCHYTPRLTRNGKTLNSPSEDWNTLAPGEVDSSEEGCTAQTWFEDHNVRIEFKHEAEAESIMASALLSLGATTETYLVADLDRR